MDFENKTNIPIPQPGFKLSADKIVEPERDYEYRWGSIWVALPEPERWYIADYGMCPPKYLMQTPFYSEGEVEAEVALRNLDDIEHRLDLVNERINSIKAEIERLRTDIREHRDRGIRFSNECAHKIEALSMTLKIFENGAKEYEAKIKDLGTCLAKSFDLWEKYLNQRKGENIDK